MLQSIYIHMPTKKLSPREIEIITLVAYGKTRGEVSRILSISDRTVQEHLEHVCFKLNATNKTHAATIAVALGLITPYRSAADLPETGKKSETTRQMADAQSYKIHVVRQSTSKRKV